ncbi:hypothetical protein AY606_00930 [Acinetobacter sp. SFB]|uniref:hypothetical protein n=1 Tax=Acinetobacter sp. SFB TaxID=1805634 RepID=UPI0007D80DAD|nr:hypothetical protein [Acinetobacter sp. SFB]OAL81343.1 hypothetical protein AY606_00930 [Acinetobacter sp. SFB]
MKILSAPYTHAHSFRALKRLHKAIICNQILHSDLHKLYQAMLHLERYVERLNRKRYKKTIQRLMLNHELKSLYSISLK